MKNLLDVLVETLSKNRVKQTTIYLDPDAFIGVEEYFHQVIEDNSTVISNVQFEPIEGFLLVNYRGVDITFTNYETNT